MNSPELKRHDARRRTLKAYQGIFKTPAGQRVLKDICQAANVFSPIKEGDLAYAEGRRSLALEIAQNAFADEDYLMDQMQKLYKNPYEDE